MTANNPETQTNPAVLEFADNHDFCTECGQRNSAPCGVSDTKCELEGNARCYSIVRNFRNYLNNYLNRGLSTLQTLPSFHIAQVLSETTRVEKGCAAKADLDKRFQQELNDNMCQVAWGNLANRTLRSHSIQVVRSGDEKTVVCLCEGGQCNGASIMPLSLSLLFITGVFAVLF